jgi:transposase-like protein
MASPQAIPIVLSDSDRGRLRGWVRRRKTAQALATRARIVLACAEPGSTNGGIAQALGVSRPTVALWRRRSAERGPDGLLDAPRPGAPRKITDGQVERLGVHLVLDDLRTHKTGIVRDWLAKRPRHHLHFTPTSASWLNLVEGWFALLTLRQIRRGVFPTVEAPEAAIRRHIEATNADPRPFVWTKGADEILDSVRRFCLRTTAVAECQETSNSSH